jgi:hypothetical protein
MLEALFATVYVRVILLFVIPYAVAQIMCLMGKCRHPYLSMFIGAGLGILVMWASPMSIAANIVSVIGVIGGEYVLTNVVFAKINDKMSDVVDKSIAKGRDRDYHLILNSPEQSERVKYLARYISNGQFCFKLHTAPETVYDAVLQKLDEAAVKKVHPQAKLVNGINGQNHVIRLECPRVAVALVAKAATENTGVWLMLDGINDIGLGLRERMALETENTTALDNFYMLIKPILRELDENCTVSFA